MNEVIALTNKLNDTVFAHLCRIYADTGLDENRLQETAQQLVSAMRIGSDATQSENSSPVTAPAQVEPYQNHWDEKDVILITYADTIVNDDEAPLQTLKTFLDNHCQPCIKDVHILPFFPYSSDDGFSVIDYYQVNPRHGDWQDIKNIAADYRMMSDLVINHCSAESEWFKNFVAGEGEGADYFYCADPELDYTKVVRPRASDLLRETETAEGKKYVWCTFSHDQVDLDFRNPAVLLEFVKIIRFYLDHDINIFRFDAVAFVWKIAGTSCINLPQTHEIIRLLRLLIETARPGAMIITETNIPNRENLTYFGNANEAHAIYNFSLPPLLVNTLISGNCRHLKSWMMSMPPAQNGTAYFNFIASHDGIGLRPAEGLLNDEELDTLLKTMQSFGGKISWRSTGDGNKKPYEINISLFDALQGNTQGKDDLGMARFICAHAIMLALEGIPGLYIHSLLGTRNDLDGVEKTGHNRSINRHQWSESALKQQLEDDTSTHHQVLRSLKKLITIRTSQAAFHPNAVQFTLQLGQQLFGFWRQSQNRRQSIFCISNISNQAQCLRLTDINLISTDSWSDLISGETYDENTSEIELAPYQTVWISNVGNHN